MAGGLALPIMDPPELASEQVIAAWDQTKVKISPELPRLYCPESTSLNQNVERSFLSPEVRKHFGWLTLRKAHMRTRIQYLATGFSRPLSPWASVKHLLKSSSELPAWMAGIKLRGPDRVWFRGRKAEMFVLVVSYLGVGSSTTLPCWWPPSRLDRANDAVVLRAPIWEWVLGLKCQSCHSLPRENRACCLIFLNFRPFCKVEMS